MITVKGIEVLGTGVVFDSQGRSMDFTTDVLDRIANSFTSGDTNGNGVALKVGHTSESFNRLIAMTLGVPDPLVSGEANSLTGEIDGQAKLGTASSVYRNGDKLVADFKDVPEGLADMIKNKLFDNVSAEASFVFDKDNNLMEASLDNIALLGAEAPAFENLKPLSETASFHVQYSLKKGTITTPETEKHLQSLESQAAELENNNGLFSGLKDLVGNLVSLYRAPKSEAPEVEITSTDEEEGGTETMDVKELLESLGYTIGTEEENAASLETIKAVLEAQKAATAEEDNKEDKSQITIGDTIVPVIATIVPVAEEEEVAADVVDNELVLAMRKQLAELVEDNEKLKQAERVSKYTMMAEGWVGIAGKPSELGSELAELEQAGHDELVTSLVARYKATSEQAVQTGRMTAQGTRASTRDESTVTDEFEVEIRAYAKEHSVSFEKATAEMAQADPDAWGAYYKRNKGK